MIYRRGSNAFSPIPSDPRSPEPRAMTGLSSSLRPSTTSSRAESVIERLRIESSDDGTGYGINIGGIFITANCSIIVIVMASIFLLVGMVLTAISYRYARRDFIHFSRAEVTRFSSSPGPRLPGCPVHKIPGSQGPWFPRFPRFPVSLVLCCIGLRLKLGYGICRQICSRTCHFCHFDCRQFFDKKPMSIQAS